MTLPDRARLCAIAALLLSVTALPAQAAVLAAFDFDAAEGGFTTAPSLLHADLASATFTATLAPLGDFAGNPGRALSSTGFTLGNRIELDVIARPGVAVQVTRLSFDARVSASGPLSWQVALGDALPQDGPLSTVFAPVTVDFVATPASPRIVIRIGGEGASSASGTLRLDNLHLEGEVLGSPVPLPAGLPAIGCGALAATVLRRRRKAIPASHRPAGKRDRA
ncbi:MAG: hypothetical protein AB7Q81_00165 [Gammaproteobacteria bacterium]